MCGMTFFVFDGRYIFLALNISLYVIFFLKKDVFLKFYDRFQFFLTPSCASLLQDLGNYILIFIFIITVTFTVTTLLVNVLLSQLFIVKLANFFGTGFFTD